MSERLPYHTNCVSWPKNKVEDLHRIIDNSIEISRLTFLKHLEREEFQELETGLGYAKHHKIGMTMASDWSISYHWSKLKGEFV